MGWRYIATRLNGDGTETLLDPDLPIEEVGIEDVLSGDQALDCTIDPVYTRLVGPDGMPILREWSTGIYAENDGDIRFGGILQTSGFSGPSWSLEAVGFTGYWRDLPYTGSGYKGIRVDPLDVAREIWDHGQNQSGGNLGLTYDATTTGGKVSIGTTLTQGEFDTQEGPLVFESGPYKLNWYENHDLAGDIDALAEATPFDYHERHFWQGDEIRHHIELGYPHIGRRREDLRFVLGVNVFEPPDIDRDGSMYASGTMVLGAGEGASMIHSIRETPTNRGRLRRIAVVQDSSIKSLDRANQRADQENQWRGRLEDISSLLVKDHPNARLGAVGVGDWVYIQGKADWLPVDMWVRVLSIAYSPADGSTAEYTVARADRLS